MVLYNEDLFKKHSEICNKLNLDSQIISTSWENYSRISKNFTLEGDPQYWLGCAVYVECRKSVTPTVGKSVVEGNCISLTSLLRHCNLSISKFFANIKKWVIMDKVPEDLKAKITLQEKKFSVSCNIFKWFVPFYGTAFRIPGPHEFAQDIENSKQHRSRKQRTTQITPVKVFEFCWYLYITLKGQDPAYSTDLVKSCELLIACVDLFFQNAYTSEMQDLLNPECKCKPVDWLNTSLEVQQDSLIDVLSKIGVNATSAISIRVHELPKMLRKLFEGMENQGSQDEFLNLFDQASFEANFRKINNAYSYQLLQHGDVDERMIFTEHRRKTAVEANVIYTTPVGNFGDASLTLDSPRPPGNISDTPLSGRKFLGPKESNIDVRASLNTMLAGRRAEPSEALLALLSDCDPNPLEKIKLIVTNLGRKFVEAVHDRSDARNKLEMATKMFYKYLESLLQNELSIGKNISVLIQHDKFYEGVFTCCLEIVLHAFNYPHRFPWILRVLNVEAWDVSSVIEVIIRSKDSQLCRLSVKHLSMVDESIMEHLIWKSGSRIWTAIKNSGQPAPRLEDVALPGHLVYQTDDQSPINNGSVIVKSQLHSPGSSAADHFQSPVNPSLSISRQLFTTSQNGQPLQRHIMITNKDGDQRLIPLVDMEVKQQESPKDVDSTTITLEPSKPKKVGRLAITFRKFYNLAGVRLEDLCTKLGLMNDPNKNDLIHKIWTLFEDSVVSTELIKERHLDQLLMCAVYVACVLPDSRHGVKFQEIMKCYRFQPQASNYIYRNVLIKPKRIEEVNGERVELPEERNDLIYFYNNVYIDEMNKSIINLSKHRLSPRPALKRTLPPTSYEVAKNVFVKPLESPSAGVDTMKSYNYYFSRSPSKDLKDINKAINNNAVSGKRLLIDTNDDQPNKRMRTSANRKVQSLIEERRSQTSE